MEHTLFFFIEETDVWGNLATHFLIKYRLLGVVSKDDLLHHAIDHLIERLGICEFNRHAPESRREKRLALFNGDVQQASNELANLIKVDFEERYYDVFSDRVQGYPTALSSFYGRHYYLTLWNHF